MSLKGLDDHIEGRDQQNLNTWEEKQLRKANRYSELAKRKAKESEQTAEHAKKMADVIPFGQPILVGHHSEQRDRNFRAKIIRTEKKSVELAETAQHYENKVDNILNPKFVSADDPNSIPKLEEKIAKLEEEKKLYDRKTYKVDPNAKYWEDGSEHHRKLELESLTRRIHDAKKRIEYLKSLQQFEGINKTIGEIRIYTDKVENRIRIKFPGKPSPEIIAKLKSYGFHWSPFNKVWQRQISNAALWAVEQIEKELSA